MRITKFEHACFVIQTDNKTLVVDPGGFTTLPGDLGNVVAIVITHEHADHWTADHLRDILDQNPDARLFGPAGVAAAASDFDITVVADGDKYEVGPFRLAFFGAKHAVIHSSIPVVDNVGVWINETVFYPGDAYTVPPVAVDMLAVPSSAPWLKIGDVMDYLAEVKPKRGFPTHEMVNSEIGKGMANDRIGGVIAAGGGEFFPLKPGDSVLL
jgi:L-ascorbate metabolism protein UlaG (beta-lactamase superfamily)